MPPPDGDVTPGELGRRMQDVLTRFQELVKQIEERYVRKDLLELVKEGFTTQIRSVESALAEIQRNMVDKATYAAEKAALEKRVSELEDSNKWLFRLVIGFVILTVLGAVVASVQVSGGGGG